jgi:hypothetical protein
MAVSRAALCALVISGCGGSASAATLQGQVTYAKSGGIAGVVQKLTVSPNGRAVASSAVRKRSFRLTKAQLKALTSTVAKAKISRTSSETDTVQGADGFSFKVAYDGDAVTWSDFSDKPPARILALYALLDELYAAHAPSQR